MCLRSVGGGEVACVDVDDGRGEARDGHNGGGNASGHLCGLLMGSNDGCWQLLLGLCIYGMFFVFFLTHWHDLLYGVIGLEDTMGGSAGFR